MLMWNSERNFAGVIISMGMLLLMLLLPSTSAKAQQFSGDFYLLLGQSNMAGRTPFIQTDFGPVPSVYLLNDSGAWEAAKILRANSNQQGGRDLGLNRYSTVRKKNKDQLLNPGDMFGLELVEADDYGPGTILPDVGVIVEARGATSIKDWQKSAPVPSQSGLPKNLFNMALERVAAAKKAGGNFRGVLWLHGESDAIHFGQNYANTVPTMDAYLTQLAAFITDFRTSSGDVNLPFFVSRITYVTSYPAANAANYNYAGTTLFNRRISEIGGFVKGASIIDSAGLKSLYQASSSNSNCPSDCVHFEHGSMETLGVRFAVAVAGEVYSRFHDYDSRHFCAVQSSPVDPVCAYLEAMRNPKWDDPEDLMIVPHRGEWGEDLGTGPPENSMSALQEAVKNKYGMTELDAMTTLDSKYVASHDYPLFRITDDETPGHFIFNQTEAELQTLRLERRNNTLSQDHVLGIDQAIPYAFKNNLILAVDAKEEIGEYKGGVCIAYCGDDTKGDGPKTPDYEHAKHANWSNMVGGILDMAKSTTDTKGDARRVIAVKTYRTPEEVMRGEPPVGKSVGYQGLGGAAEMAPVMWVPMIISGHFNNDIQAMAEFVEGWAAHKEWLAYIETDYKSATDPILQPFTRSEGPYIGRQFVNLLHFIKEVTGRRAGIFTDEPVGNRGVVTRWALWKMKNPGLDRRSDHLWVTSFPYSKHMAVTADSVATWQALKTVLAAKPE